jgi:predicted MFS family arabinose efflux permease
MDRVGGQLSESLAAVRSVFANPNLRRIELAFAGSAIGNYAFAVAISIYAFHQGGVTAVGIVTAVRQAAAASIAPFAASLSDRFRRERVMLISDAGRIACTGGIAILVSSGAPTISVYALAVGASVFGAVFRPAEASLVPLVAQTPQELTAANITASTFDSVGIFAGPALGAFLIAFSGYTAAFAVVAGTFAWSALFVVRISAGRRAAAKSATDDDHGDGEAGGLRSLLDGFRTIAHEPRLRLLIGLYDAQCFVAGALGVLIVATAIDLLGIGNAGVGILQSACGVGAIVGAGIALTLVSRSRLGRDLALGLVLWGVPLILVGALPYTFIAVLGLAVLGIGNTLVDISAMTLIQRTAVPEVAGRIFGVLESSIVASLALGALTAPALINLLGARGALLTVGAILPLLAVVTSRRLAVIDAGAKLPQEQIAAIRTVPFLKLLPLQMVEYLAGQMRQLELPSGATLFREGDHGDSFYILERGTLEIDLPEGVKRESAPAFVGEIALLRDIPRTATVRAGSDAALWALDRQAFLAAVGGHAHARGHADSIVVARLDAANANAL